MSEVLYEKPDISTSVFVLVPKSAEEKEFVSVVDKEKEKGRKLPGGGASKDRAIPNSATAELFEETRLVISPPTQKVLEVHKIGPNGPHHWVAVKSLPPVSCASVDRKCEELTGSNGETRFLLESEIAAMRQSWPLEAGTEIKEVCWETTEVMLQNVAERKFFADHAKAIKWYLSRKSQPALEDILLDRRIISWFADEDGCLVLCYDPDCGICDRPEEPKAAAPEETMEAYLPKGELKKSSLLMDNAPVREIRPKVTEPGEQTLSGAVEVMLVTADRFDETLWLAVDYSLRSREAGRDFDLRREYKHAVSPHVVELKEPTTATELAKTFGMAVERQSTLHKPGRMVVLLFGTLLNKDAKGRPIGPTGFIAFSLNGTLPSDIHIGFEQAKLIPEVVERFNRCHAPNTLWMHDNWGHLAREIKYKGILKKESERESRERHYASA
mgnify:CR=1 FL=1